jgi:hypothetical protein
MFWSGALSGVIARYFAPITWCPLERARAVGMRAFCHGLGISPKRLRRRDRGTVRSVVMTAAFSSASRETNRAIGDASRELGGAAVIVRGAGESGSQYHVVPTLDLQCRFRLLCHWPASSCGQNQNPRCGPKTWFLSDHADSGRVGAADCQVSTAHREMSRPGCSIRMTH